uniref:Uncharacterized protein MANES_08G115600 n=1 Tax=Rhizophora mucronata TaxID=61149 RepID=A0A2P2KET0_RHIMU
MVKWRPHRPLPPCTHLNPPLHRTLRLLAAAAASAAAKETQTLSRFERRVINPAQNVAGNTTIASPQILTILPLIHTPLGVRVLLIASMKRPIIQKGRRKMTGQRRKRKRSEARAITINVRSTELKSWGL